MKIVLIVAAVLSIVGFAGIFTQEWRLSQIENSSISGKVKVPGLLTMGPDPGGHTGATVTPETTKTGQPAVDNAREAASGGTTENSGPPMDSSRQSKK